MEAIFTDDFAATCEDMELSKVGLIFSASLLLALALSPAAARAQFGGLSQPGGAGNMMSKMMQGNSQKGRRPNPRSAHAGRQEGDVRR